MSTDTDDGGRESPAVGSARVEISAAARSVTVEAPEPLAVVADTALRMWLATDDPNLDKAFGSLGFGGELAGGRVVADLRLPDRMSTGEDRR